MTAASSLPISCVLWFFTSLVPASYIHSSTTTKYFLPTGQGYSSSRPPPQLHMHQMSCAYCSLQLSLLAVPLGSRQGWGCSSPVTGHCTVLPRLVPDARRNILALGGRKTGPKMSGCWHCPQEDIGHSMSGFTSSRVVGTSCCCQDFKTTAVTT